MVRPLSAEKHQTLIQTAIALIAEQGLSAGTANIAKQAGVAGGTLFTYFDSKEALFNQAYLSIKADIAAAVSGSGNGGVPIPTGACVIRANGRRCANWNLHCC
ncbi:TetR/AcrR family transcriptional regulator [Neisseria musculi]|uniref:Bacterial regulatory tetR family protein n=1 Tax=Neisseria musculi TaxID=1815583 RepID=A0A7H1MB73_9NEIS|nr:TetR/AcrR family transcriptional regulator [Neisseria musculi]QNT58888.1 bacterial regulatory, tetR family protein [Neisseria musculi]